MRVALITNYNISEKANAAMTVAERLKSFHCKVVVPLAYRDRIDRTYRHRANFAYDVPANIYKTAELIIVLGGDGSIMEAARNAAPYGIPVLGINMGRVGYLAELEMSEIALLDRVLAGDYKLDKRTMLNAEVISANGKEARSAFALNDAVISNGSISRIIDLQLSESGVPINIYRADGLIIATPTGTTAYSMSAGGPVADPRISCFCVTPICPHFSVQRSILFPDTAVIDVKHICRREKLLYLTLDGRISFELMRNDVVRITKSDLVTSIVRVKERSFYEKLRQKNI